MLFIGEYFKHRLTISAEITMMSMDSVKMVDTNGNIHSLTKLQVILNYIYNTVIHTLMYTR